MPDIRFLALRNDLSPLLRDIETELKIQYIPCWAKHSNPPVLFSASEISDKDFDVSTYFVTHAGAPYTVKKSDDEPEGSEESYETVISPDVAWFFISFGGLRVQPSGQKIVQGGSISTFGADYSDATYCLYRELATRITAQFTQCGDYPFWLGAHALDAGQAGALYALDSRDISTLHGFGNVWSHADVSTCLVQSAREPPRLSRLDLNATWTFLEQNGYEPPRDEEGNPYIAKGDFNEVDEEEEEGEDHLSLFGSGYVGIDLSRLTMPHTLFAESEFSHSQFVESDLSRSNSHASDWLDCDLHGADLSGADLRGCRFLFCDFRECDLRKADLRNSSFIGCQLAGARLDDACIDADLVALGVLSPEQRRQVRLRCRERPYGSWG